MYTGFLRPKYIAAQRNNGIARILSVWRFVAAALARRVGRTTQRWHNARVTRLITRSYLRRAPRTLSVLLRVA